MKAVISLFSFVLLSIFFTACFQGNKEQPNVGDGDNFENYSYEENEAVNYEPIDNQMAKNDAMKYFNTIDSRNGIVMSRIPLPSSWQKQNGGDYLYTGPNGIKIHGERGGSFIFSKDPQMNQMYQQSGMQVQLPKSIEQVINEGFMEYADKINRKLVRKYPMPQIAAWDKQFDDQLYKSMPSQKTFTVMGLEWRDPDGTSFLTILHHFVSYDQYGGYWGITYSVLEASEGAFDQAKTQYINGLLNQQINPQWLQAVNQKDMQIAQQSNAAHQQRMANIKSFGDQNTARFNDRMAAMDQNMASWRANQAASDRNQEQFVDYIYGNTNVSDPNTGQTYKVEAGANQYWMNNQGEYIKSDNSLYNPNLDQNINNQTWTEYEEQN
ncbi:hypothetical protein [Aequorivita vladivostokensis]|uniref:Lipoprotein n=1 Tax=Aequorivita vladivostokensis TaxID=171194 RepID=A0ABR5DGC2_9FLAO|nr:hypothetical protein [Aequorivita vladivostokensis]KJJ37823.1 hypothetical protein MB09_12365 [Aequorivita vladivostokensis]|tara:strand:- start:4122 stop:5264 length:1143 start_codon:yes stop_codon:yes gene_type:complete